jgi:hypothetical protein
MALEINEGYKQLDTKTLNQEEKLRQMVEMARQLEASAMQVLDIYNKRNENAHENLRPETLDAEQVDVNESTEAVRTELDDVRKADETLDNKPLSFEEMSVDKNLIDNIDIDSILAQDKAQATQSYDEMQANLNSLNDLNGGIDLNDILADIESEIQSSKVPTSNSDMGMAM